VNEGFAACLLRSLRLLPVPFLLEQGHDLYAYYYNPKLSIFTEYDKRKAGFYNWPAYNLR
jgi:predicted adenine nucleotide alpha hydrolase (AANH) superfamily ATPase